MNEFLLEYGHIPAYVIIALFMVFWITIPWYLGECAKTRMLIDKIQNGETVTFRDLDKNISNVKGIEFAFGSLPNEDNSPQLFKNPTFRKHIKDLKKLQQFYQKAIIIISILITLVFAGRVYVVRLERQQSTSAGTG